MNHSSSTKNPTGEVGCWRGAKKPALHDNLMTRVLDRENMQKAWKRVKSNKGAPGIDGMALEEFPRLMQTQWPKIRQTLMDGQYQPSPVRRVMIPKPHGGKRMLGIPTVLDRVIQQAIQQILTPIFDPDFSKSSFGFRPKRSAHGAIRHVQKHIEWGQCYVAVDLDLAKFFDRVNHDVLMVRVARKVRDKQLLALIGRYLRAGALVGDIIKKNEMGTPQGGPLSPLLANILLDDLDRELEKRRHHFARYADDLTILVRSKRAGDRVKRSITRYLKNVLRLEVNQDKSRVVPTDEMAFLGFTFKGTKIRWSKKSFDGFKCRLRKLTGRSWGVSMEYRIVQLNRYLRGWMNYYGISQHYRPIPTLDPWLRRRIRMCYWKQWRHVRTRVGHLLALGTWKRQAIMTGISRKGPWHISRSLATQSGMTNKWLKEQGLVSIKDLWIKAQGYS